MKRLQTIAFAALFILSALHLKSQNYEFAEWTKDKKDQANTAKNADYLSDNEKKVVFFMNLARLDGKLFCETYLDKYVDENGLDKNNDYIKSLYKDLKKCKDLPMLKPTKNLTKAARFHAKDMGKLGKTGHNSSDGTSFSNRLKKYVKATTIGENCQYGYNDPLAIVMDLLIDEGIVSLGHRKNILNPEYLFIGTAIEDHTDYKWNCVQDFAATDK